MDLSTVTAGLLLAGRYRLEALLAHSSGVMSWRANDQVLSRPVLVHLLEPEDERIGWVLRAARDAATANDPRFLRVLDALEASGQEPWSFVVCEFAVGDPVYTLLADGPLSGPQAGYIVHELATALAPMHARGMFHLRIRPDTVIITSNGHVKIVGFLIDAALRPVPGQDELTWSELEAIDTTALGSLLYACTTGRWPVPPSEPQRQHWGLAPAPLRETATASAAGEAVWPAPNELNHDIDPRLSSLTMAVLRPPLGLVGPSLRTADDVADSLEGVIDLTGAEESLENLVRRRRGLAATPVTPALLDPGVNSAWPTRDAGPPTLRFEAITPDPVPPRTTRTPFPPSDADQEPTIATAAMSSPAPVRPPVPQPQRPQPVPAPPRQQPSARGGVLGRRGLWLLVAFVVVALVVLQIRGCADSSNRPGATESTSVAAPEPVTIVSAFDFDPVADGGDQNENSDQARFAADGDPSTVWRTLTYLENSAFGGLKPGVGMVFDLGREAQVESVSLLLDNQPNAIQLMVPNEADPSAARPPMETVKQWRIIASDPAAGLQVTLRPEEPVQTRWVMVYFTKLPPVGPALYRSGIAETYINR